MPRPLLVLWDIDRTLLFAGGVDKGVWRSVCSRLVGHPVDNLGATSGRTDPQILLEAFQLAGLDEAQARRLLPEALRLEAAELVAKQDELRAKGHELPGAKAALAALGDQPGVVQSVLTGNIRPNAVLKLRTFDLDRYLKLDIGAYGSDNPHRPTLVRVARQRAIAALGLAFDESTTILIGDSARDVEAGRIGGARVIAVATGRTDVQALRAVGAHVVLRDLADTDLVLRAVLEDHDAAWT
jgi:phosphoglycolate phosphatase